MNDDVCTCDDCTGITQAKSQAFDAGYELGRYESYACDDCRKYRSDVFEPDCNAKWLFFNQWAQAW